MVRTGNGHLEAERVGRFTFATHGAGRIRGEGYSIPREPLSAKCTRLTDGNFVFEAPRRSPTSREPSTHRELMHSPAPSVEWTIPMKTRTSELRGFYKLRIEERRALIAEATGIDAHEIATALHAGGLAAETADKFVENVLGTYALPFGVAINVRVNSRDYIVPMVVEEPSVIAAASNAAKMIRAGGGFEADTDPPMMTCQVQLYDVPNPESGAERIERESATLLGLANRALSGLVDRGGGAREIEVRRVGSGMLVVHIYIDCCDAMGANLVNSAAEAVGDRIAELGGGKRGLRILSNLCDRRCVRVRCRVSAEAVATESMSGPAVVDGILNASQFAEHDPYRAATHNKGIMNGIDAVCIATGNDWRAVEAGAHAFAARSGRYQPLAIWRKETLADGSVQLRGAIELPLALGTVGGTLRVHPAARLALRILGTETASELAMIAASMGLASNLAAVRALASDGIQKGHMALHARAVAIAAGATSEQVERVALMIVEARDITVEGARRALEQMDSGNTRDATPRE
jgi:hydroxymethylglutaryl-CoA reductase